MIPFESIRTTTANKITSCDIIIKVGMEEYSGWGWIEHVQWVRDSTGLSGFFNLVSKGYLIVTNEELSLVWLVSNDYWKSTASKIH